MKRKNSEDSFKISSNSSNITCTFPDFTKKEIFTQGVLIEQFLNKYIKNGKINLDYLKIKAEKMKRVYIIGSGSDFSCAVFGAYNFEVLFDVVSIPACTGEFMCSNPILDKFTLVVLIGGDCQVEKRCNVSGANCVIISDFENPKLRNSLSVGYKTMGKFSTAAHSLKMTALVILALYLAQKSNVVTALYIRYAIKMLFDLKDKIKDVLSLEFILKQAVKKIDLEGMIFTGTNVDYATAIYASDALNEASGAFSAAVPYSQLLIKRYEKKNITAIASDENSSLMFDNKSPYTVGILPLSIEENKKFSERKLFCETILYNETIPLLNPILCSVVIQIMIYCKYIDAFNEQ